MKMEKVTFLQGQNFAHPGMFFLLDFAKHKNIVIEYQDWYSIIFNYKTLQQFSESLEYIILKQRNYLYNEMNQIRNRSVASHL